MRLKQSKDDLIKEEILNPEKAKKRREDRKRKIAIIWLSVVAGIFFLITGGFYTVRAIGISNLKNQTKSKAPSIESEEESNHLVNENPEEISERWEEGWIRYQGKVYAYNEDILTFLFMGIDKNSEVKETENTKGGQADALFLLVLDESTKKVELIGINRDSMTDIMVYNDYGAYIKSTKAQVALQHAFGEGGKKSAEYTVDAVAELFYDLPIHGYCALNMAAIPTLNDALGGIELTCLEDLTKFDSSLIKDENVTLQGKNAFWYVKYRDVNVFNSNGNRLMRQKQYLTSYADKLKKNIKANPTLALNMYQMVVPYMTTNITVDEVTYLATEIPSYQFAGNNVHMIEGDTVMGETYEEFHVDETALKQLIIDIFYKEIIVE